MVLVGCVCCEALPVFACAEPDAVLAEAIVHGILPADTVRVLFLVVALSMAATPFLADFGQRLGKMFEKGDMKVRHLLGPTPPSMVLV